jgi:hypothetical protein
VQPITQPNVPRFDRWEARKRLAALVSIPDIRDPQWEAKASEFLEKYGPLRKPMSGSPRTKRDYALDAATVAAELRRIWKPLKECSGNELEHTSSFLDSIFEPNPYEMWQGPAVRTDFAAGRWEPAPRNQLDVLAIELMRSRKMLSRCQSCGKYMVKETSRDYYCSTSCSAKGGSLRKSQWANDPKNRARINLKRRKSKKRRTA